LISSLSKAQVSIFLKSKLGLKERKRSYSRKPGMNGAFAMRAEKEAPRL